MESMERDGARLNPPAGFRFNPNDEQAAECYLKPKNEDGGLTPRRDFIPEFDIYSRLPDQFPRNSQYGKRNEFYFFVPEGKSRKIGETGYFWRATDGKKKIKIKGEDIAAKSDLVLRSKKKNMKWKMHEYRLVDQPTSSRLGALHCPATDVIKSRGSYVRHKRYVLCKIFLKGGGEKENACASAEMIPLESGSANATPCSPHFSAKTSNVINLAGHAMQQQVPLDIISTESNASNAADASASPWDYLFNPSSSNCNWPQQQEAAQSLSPAGSRDLLLNPAAADRALPAIASPPSLSCQDQDRFGLFPETDHQLLDIPENWDSSWWEEINFDLQNDPYMQPKYINIGN
ncbi:hypothetical protein ACLOJK_020164 [Asimina triloba]